METDPQGLIDAIESHSTQAIIGAALLMLVGIVRAFLEPRLGETVKAWVSAIAAIAAALGPMLIAGVVWWHALILCLFGVATSAGLYRLLFGLIPKGWGGAMLILLLVTLPLTAGACEPEDRGLMVIRGVEAHAAAYPVPVSAEPELLEETTDAVDWLNGQASSPRPCEFGAGVCVATIIWAEIVDEGLGVVHVMDGTTAPDFGGYTTVEIAESGAILAADVVVQVGYSEAHHLRHELGHGVLGLDDDPESIDLRSIMSSPNTLPDGRITDHDFAEAQRAWSWES